MIDINKLILEATKAKKEAERDVYRLIKARFIEYTTQPSTPTLDEKAQFSILNKMVTERKEDAKMYESAQKYAEANKELKEAEIIQALLPAPVSEEEILKCIDEYISENGALTKKDMGKAIKVVMAQHPSAPGKTISSLVNSRIQ